MILECFPEALLLILVSVTVTATMTTLSLFISDDVSSISQASLSEVCRTVFLLRHYTRYECAGLSVPLRIFGTFVVVH
jgi:hypothetical protein